MRELFTVNGTGYNVEQGDESDALHERELQPSAGAGLSFSVIGAEGEKIGITVLAPAASAADTSMEGRLAAGLLTQGTTGVPQGLFDTPSRTPGTIILRTH